MDCIQAVHTTLAQCGWIISPSLPHVFCATVPCVYCVHVFRAFPHACCGFRYEIIVLGSIWPFNNLASSTAPHLLLSWRTLERTEDWCRVCIGNSSYELPSFRAHKYFFSPQVHLPPVFHVIPFAYISSAELRRIHRARSHPHRATSRPMSLFSSAELLIKY